MANLRIPAEERNLAPAQVEELDALRRRGQLFLVLGLQALVVTALLCLWVGQDLTHSPGWQRPIFYWAAFTGAVSLGCFLRGLSLRRGLPEFMSY